MPIKFRILCIISAICFLASTACLTGYAVEMMDRYSGDDDVTIDPTPDVSYVDPPYVEPEPEPSYVEPSYVEPEPEPSYVEPSEPDVSSPTSDYTPSEPNYGESSDYSSDVSQLTPSDLISDGNFPQGGTSSTYTSSYIDYTSQYIANTYSATYDDNYVYIPSYTEPEQSMIQTSSKYLDTDELTADDWASIMLNLEDGNISDDGTKTFNFIKQNNTEGDTSISWMLYLGVALILMSVFLIMFVVISTKKAASRLSAA